MIKSSYFYFCGINFGCNLMTRKEVVSPETPLLQCDQWLTVDLPVEPQCSCFPYFWGFHKTWLCFRPVIHITEPKVQSKVINPKGHNEAGVQPAHHPGKTKASTPGAEDSDTDEAPVAQQMLSFVMDDPDFESEASDTPQIIKVSQSSIEEMFLWMKFAFYLSRSSPLVMLRKMLI